MLLTTVAWAEESAEELLQQAGNAAEKGDSAEADRLPTLAIKQNEKLSAAYYLRGRERFRLGRIKDSVTDFHRYVTLRPDAESRQWERGIADYYAKQYEKGAKQFELYQTFHNNDVENSVWRYLCMVPDHGIEKARAVMLPIKNDRRVPMMQVYELYRGNLKPAAFPSTFRTTLADRARSNFQFPVRFAPCRIASGHFCPWHQLAFAATDRLRTHHRTHRSCWLAADHVRRCFPVLASFSSRDG